MATPGGLSFRWEWEKAPGVRAPEHRATWARIEISVGRECVTLVEDEESGSSRRSIYCPLYPLAEWVAYNWWFLRADARLARTPDLSRLHRIDARLFRRHSLRGCGDGFLWPNLLIVPEGEGKRLVWFRDRTPSPPRRPIRFLSEGEALALLDGASVEGELAGLVASVLTRLAERGVTGTCLEKEWTAIQETDADEAEFCIAAARLGLDPYSEAEPYEHLIVQAAAELQGNLLGDFYDAVEPALIGEALDWIRSARTRIGQTAQGPEAAALRQDLGPFPGVAVGPAWERGWSQARAVRRSLGLSITEAFPLTPYIKGVTMSAADRALRAVGGAAEGRGPVAVVRRNLPSTAHRFTLARALWHYLWEAEPLFLVTNAYTDRQRRERAFATELLAPAEGIAEMLGTAPEAALPDDIEEIAARLQVSPMVVKHQVDNQLLAV